MKQLDLFSPRGVRTLLCMLLCALLTCSAVSLQAEDASGERKPDAPEIASTPEPEMATPLPPAGEAPGEPAARGVYLYSAQSEGTASLTYTLRDGALTSGAEPLFTLTNVQADITLIGVTLSASSGVLLRCHAENDGVPGQNGGHVHLTAVRQLLSGDVECDALSSAALTLSDGTTFTGAINTANTAQQASLSMSADTVWNVTADSHLSVLTNEDATLSNIISGGFTITYDARHEDNAWLAGETYALSGDGLLMPAIEPTDADEPAA